MKKDNIDALNWLYETKKIRDLILTDLHFLNDNLKKTVKIHFSDFNSISIVLELNYVVEMDFSFNRNYSILQIEDFKILYIENEFILVLDPDSETEKFSELDNDYFIAKELKININ